MAPLLGVFLERCTFFASDEMNAIKLLCVLEREMQHTFLASDEMNGIKYAAYRTAMKLRALQKVTHCKSCYCEGM